MNPSKQKQLATLLTKLFPTHGQLQQFIHEVDAEIVVHMAGPHAPLATHTYDAVRELDRRGLITPALFSQLIEEIPTRGTDVLAVARAWFLSPEESPDSSGAAGWIMHSLEREATLLARLASMDGELARLRERVTKLEAKTSTAPPSKEEEWTRLVATLNATKFDMSKAYPSAEGDSPDANYKNVPAINVLMVHRDWLTGGIRSDVSTDHATFLFYRFVPTLKLYDLIEDVKLPAKAYHKEVRLSKAGRDFVAWTLSRYPEFLLQDR